MINASQVKAESEMQLKKLQLTFNENLPELDKFDPLKFKSPQEIAQRIVILAQLIGIHFDAGLDTIKSYLHENRLYHGLSSNENNLINKVNPSEQDKIDVYWYCEAIEMLGWSIGLWESVELLKFCNEDRQVATIPLDQNPKVFIESAKLIDKEEIYKQADLIYRVHWISKRRNIGELSNNSSDVYMERHKAINWIISKSSWDKVATDT